MEEGEAGAESPGDLLALELLGEEEPGLPVQAVAVRQQRVHPRHVHAQPRTPVLRA